MLTFFTEGSCLIKTKNCVFLGSKSQFRSKKSISILIYLHEINAKECVADPDSSDPDPGFLLIRIDIHELLRSKG
jgi:hypothetical protein